MKLTQGISWKRWGMAALLACTAVANAVPTQATPWTENRENFASPAFAALWKGVDEAVTTGRVARSYTFGPRPWFDYKEFYQQAPNGLRQVQYFDKARMEINNPTNSTASGVTNGLLTVEMVSGRLKLGDAITPDQNPQREPANVPVAGNPADQNPNAPTYASFKGVATIDNGYRDNNRIGQRVGATLDKFGNISNNGQLAQDAATEIVAYNSVTGHNIPRVFRDFINNGPVDGLFAFGYPISDPYWVRARVGDSDKDVLVQLYERRAVTYTPSNPAAFRVEMGNVGQHYFQWRYAHLGQPWQPNAAHAYNQPIVYASTVNKHWEVFLMSGPDSRGPQITATGQETVPYSWRRSYLGGAVPRLMTDSRRIDGARKLFSIDSYNYNDVRQHSVTFGAPTWQFYNGAVSPDGTMVALIADHTDPQINDNFHTIAFQPFARDQLFPYMVTNINTECVYQSPSWFPDGSGIIFASNCSGKFQVYRADLKYVSGDIDNYLQIELVNVRAITNTPPNVQYDNYFPRISPDGTKVAFASNRNGNGDLYVINADGSGEQRLTTDPRDDGATSWSPDGRDLVFDSNRDGDYEIYRLSLNSPNTVTQMTNNTVDDRWPLWEQ